MSRRHNGIVTLGIVLSVSLIAAAASFMLASCRYSRMQYNLLNAVCGEVLGREPEARNILLSALKEYKDGNAGEKTGEKAEEDVLSALGYRRSDFSDPFAGQNAALAAAGALPGFFLFIMTFFYRNQKETRRIQALADYLEQVNTGKAAILSASGEDDFSKLE